MLNLTYRTAKTSIGSFGFTWNNTFLRNFDVIVPTATGEQVISREGTEQGSPSQGFPKWKSIGILDWDWRQFRRHADRPLRFQAARAGRQRDEVAVLHRRPDPVHAVLLG